MNIVSMTTRSLRDILRRSQRQPLDFSIRVARDVTGPGGGVMIPAHNELTERHLGWLEQRNPAHGRAPTYVEVIFVPSPGKEMEPGPQVSGTNASSGEERRRRAVSGAGQVHARAEGVVEQAREVFDLVGVGAFSPSALRNPKVQANLQELEGRLRSFHGAVRAALEEYLGGNTLIMDLITQYAPGSRQVQHGLNVAVLATEVAAQAWITGGTGLDLLEEEGAGRRELAAVFLGGFMHDCGLWTASELSGEGHESAGARFVRSLAGVGEMAAVLADIVLFHSDLLRLATREGVLRVEERLDGSGEARLGREFFGSMSAARNAARNASPQRQAQLVPLEAMRRILPVAMAEEFLSRTDRPQGEPPARIATRLAAYARGGAYEQCLVALCNARQLAPRRTQVTVRGRGAGGDERSDVPALHEGCSIGHGEDRYSPHIVVLFSVGRDGMRRNLDYVDPRGDAFWKRPVKSGSRFYLPLGNHHADISWEVTGFMEEELYGKVLEGYEYELARRMLS